MNVALAAAPALSVPPLKLRVPLPVPREVEVVVTVPPSRLTMPLALTLLCPRRSPQPFSMTDALPDTFKVPAPISPTYTPPSEAALPVVAVELRIPPLALATRTELLPPAALV